MLGCAGFHGDVLTLVRLDPHPHSLRSARRASNKLSKPNGVTALNSTEPSAYRSFVHAMSTPHPHCLLQPINGCRLRIYYGVGQADRSAPDPLQADTWQEDEHPEHCTDVGDHAVWQALLPVRTNRAEARLTTTLPMSLSHPYYPHPDPPSRSTPIR